MTTRAGKAGKGSRYKEKNPREYLKGWLDGYDCARNAALAFGTDIEKDSPNPLAPDSLKDGEKP